MSKNFLLFEDTKCIAAINATSYVDTGKEFEFFNGDKLYLSVPYWQRDKNQHIYTITEGANADGSSLRARVDCKNIYNNR